MSKTKHVMRPLDRGRDRPPIPFLGKPPYGYFLGLELEIERPNYNGFDCAQSCQDTIRRVLGADAPPFNVGYDGSLDSGVEIRSAPMSLDIHRDIWRELLPALRADGYEATTRCGGHIHISRYQDEQWFHANVLDFIYRDANNAWLTRLAGRGSTNYCQRANVQSRPAPGVRAAGHESHHGTFELRLFASTLDYAALIPRLEFCEALMLYARSKKFRPSVVGMAEWIQETSWRKRYETLIAAHFTPAQFALRGGDHGNMVQADAHLQLSMIRNCQCEECRVKMPEFEQRYRTATVVQPATSAAAAGR